MFPLAHFLRQELRDAPGRASYTLRLTLSCAVLITLFMTLQIPFLAVALIVVFYVSQPNVLMIKLVPAYLQPPSFLSTYNFSQEFIRNRSVWRFSVAFCQEMHRIVNAIDYACSGYVKQHVFL